MKKKTVALVTAILLSLSLTAEVFAATSPTTRTVTPTITTPVTANATSGYSLTPAEQTLTATTPLEAATLVSLTAFDPITVDGRAVMVANIAPAAAFVANVKAALIKDAALRASLSQLGVGANGAAMNIVGGSVLAGTDYVGNLPVSMSIPGVGEQQEVVFLVYRLGSKTPELIKPVKQKNGKYTATLPVPCSWYAVTSR